MENQFFETLFFLPKFFKKILEFNYTELNNKNCVWNKFWTLGSGQTRNMHFHFHAFSGWGTCQSPELIKK